ncbi:hypothetical protein JMN32_08030 [Fulvivirga sp. 29W222]|uniref:DUF6265 domain-containing protein n=1 Tax=Fulvivirga marina TaxID=2494733 RepID=A0A937KBJ3_9BACT|nr:DUF6265 family protein [Fulvivirga marina]MBL6446252.1 hypothetical protein [Fulvivirga marina]
MKSFCYLLLLLTPCAYGYGQLSDTGKLSQLSWLVGKWERQNMKPGKVAHERWEFVSDRLNGWGVTLVGADTVFLEQLQIVVNDKGLFYVAEVSENEAPVYFEIVELRNDGFVCENQAHDFPKRIDYVYDGDQLKTTISGGGREASFSFRKAIK